MKREDAARYRRRIGVIAKQGLARRRDIFKTDLPLFLYEVIGDAAHVTLGLVGEAGKRRPFGLGFDDPAKPAIDKESVVDRTGAKSGIRAPRRPGPRRRSSQSGSARPSRRRPSSGRSPRGRCPRGGRQSWSQVPTPNSRGRMAQKNFRCNPEKCKALCVKRSLASLVKIHKKSVLQYRFAADEMRQIARRRPFWR